MLNSCCKSIAAIPTKISQKIICSEYAKCVRKWNKVFVTFYYFYWCCCCSPVTFFLFGYFQYQVDVVPNTVQNHLSRENGALFPSHSLWSLNEQINSLSCYKNSERNSFAIDSSFWLILFKRREEVLNSIYT